VHELGLFFSPDDPVSMLILDNITTDPLTLTFLLDDQDRIVGVDLRLDIAITDLDISAAVGAPEGYTIDLDRHESQSLRFTAINEPLARVEAPEIKTVSLPAFDPLPRRVNCPGGNDRVFYEVSSAVFTTVTVTALVICAPDRKARLSQRWRSRYDGRSWRHRTLAHACRPIPSYHGYDVTDYYTIEEDYGTNQDFLDLMQAAHARDMVVIVDLVMNHTSSEHPWFVASREGDPTYADWYIWTDDPPTIAALEPAGLVSAGDRAYFALFWSGMPDLNYENPAVTAQMYDIIRFWLEDMGVDGFRLDAIRTWMKTVR